MATENIHPEGGSEVETPAAQGASGEPSAREYPIRALVKHDAGTMPSLGWPAPGSIVMAKQGKGSEPWNNAAHYYVFDEMDQGTPFPFTRNELIINPTPEQIAEERAKAGLPAPKPSPAEGSAEVTPLDAPEGSFLPFGEAVEYVGNLLAEFRAAKVDGRATVTLTSQEIQCLAQANHSLRAARAAQASLRSSNEGLRSALEGLFNGGWTKEAIETARAALGKAGAA